MPSIGRSTQVWKRMAFGSCATLLLHTQKHLTEIPDLISPPAYCRKVEKKSTTNQTDRKKKKREDITARVNKKEKRRIP